MKEWRYVPIGLAAESDITLSAGLSTITVSDNETLQLSELQRLVKVDTSEAGHDIELDLPSAASAGDGAWVEIQLTDATEFCNVNADGAELIDGATTFTLVLAGQFVRLVCDGVGWNVAAESGTVERGQTSDGYYTKYADGRPECWHTLVIPSISAASGNVYQSSDTAWSYPRTFKARPNLSCTANRTSAWANIRGSDGATANIRGMSGINTITDMEVLVRAAGEWL